MKMGWSQVQTINHLQLPKGECMSAKVTKTVKRDQVAAKGLIQPAAMPLVSKRWGYELWICNNEKYCGKILFFKRGHQCSLHGHKIKDEVLYVHEGQCEFRIHDPTIHEKHEEDTFLLSAGEAWHITPEVLHQMTAVTDVTIFEISTQHFDSDSYRKEKGTG